MDMSEEDKDMWKLGIAFLLFVVFGMVFIWNVIDQAYEAERVRNEHNRQICEGKGGVYLTRTYQSGKMTNHTYTCVKKDTIIDMGVTNGTR
jgi:hypothetical protein